MTGPVTPAVGATSRLSVEVLKGGPATPEEVAALVAALEVLAADRRPTQPPVSPWRWSGRRWASR